jgi:hypothetical protein
MLDLIFIGFSILLGTKKHFSTFHSNDLTGRLSIILTIWILWNTCDTIGSIVQMAPNDIGESESIGFFAGIGILFLCSMSWILSRQNISKGYNTILVLLSMAFYLSGILVVVSGRVFVWENHQSDEIPVLTGAESIHLSSKWAILCYLVSMTILQLTGGEKSSIVTNMHFICEIMRSLLESIVEFSELWIRQFFCSSEQDNLDAQINPAHVVSESDQRDSKGKEKDLDATVLFTELPVPKLEPVSRSEEFAESNSSIAFTSPEDMHSSLLVEPGTPQRSTVGVSITESRQPDLADMEASESESTQHFPPGSPTIHSLRKKDIEMENTKSPPQSPGTPTSSQNSPSSSLPFGLSPKVKKIYNSLTADQEEYFRRLMNGYKEHGPTQSRAVRSQLFPNSNSEAEIRKELSAMLYKLQDPIELNSQEVALVLIESLALNTFLQHRDGPIRSLKTKQNRSISNFGDVLGCTKVLQLLLSGAPNLLRLLGTDGDNGILVFNGNFISDDQLADDTETNFNIFLFLLLVQVLFPDQIVLIPGSNERSVEELFRIEMKYRYPDISTDLLPAILSLLPSAALIDESFFFCPEGIPYNYFSDVPTSLAQFRHMVESYSFEAVEWLEPTLHLSIIQYDNYNAEYFVKQNGLKMVIRSNLPCWEGVDALSETLDATIGCSSDRTPGPFGPMRPIAVAVESKTARFVGFHAAAMLLERNGSGTDWKVSTILA